MRRAHRPPDMGLGLAASDGGIAPAQCMDGAGASSPGRLSNSIEQLFEHDGVVVSFIPGSEEQAYFFLLERKLVQPLQGFLGLRSRQLFHIFLAEALPQI